jgi:DMSO/TMAO reductase YedYZ molybdopterin-dependent catalytic subunit
VPDVPARLELSIAVGDQAAITIGAADFARLQRREIVADLHCVATWTYRDLAWSGYAFRDVYEQLIAPHVHAGAKFDYVEFKALDGYRTCILLADLLDEDVLLADQLQGEPISKEHGAPLRLIVPQLYGYKNVKHVCAIKMRPDFRRSAVDRQTQAHPRARVALEERGRVLPGPVWRILYRAVFPLSLWIYRRAEKRRT